MKRAEVLRNNNTIGITKKVEEGKPGHIATARDDRIKKIHKANRKGKHINNRVGGHREGISDQPEDPFREVFQRIYSEQTSLDSLLNNISNVEELADPEQLAGFLLQSMTRAVGFYRSGLNICCIKIFHDTLRTSENTVAESLTDFKQNRTNLLQLLKGIHNSFVEILGKNQQVSRVLEYIAMRNAEVREYFGEKLAMESVNDDFFRELMFKNDFLKGICQFAENLVAEQGFHITKEQREELKLIIEYSQMKPKPKKNKKKKRQDDKPQELTAEQLQQLQQQSLLQQLAQLSIPRARLICEFDDDMLMGFLKQIQNGI